MPRPPRGEGLGGETAWGDWCGCGWGWRGRGTSRSLCPLLLLQPPPARRPWPVRGPSPAFAACWGPRHGRPRRWRGSPGPRLQLLARPLRSPLRLRQPLAMRPVPAPGLPPVSAACRGPRSGPRRGSLGLRSPLPARLGPPPGAGRQGLLLGRRGRSPQLGQASRAGGGGPTSTAASASLRSSRSARAPPSTPGRRGSGSGTGGGCGRPAGGSHRSLPSLLSWWACVVAGAPFPLPPGASVLCRGQCRAVLCGGEGGRGWGAGCGVIPARAGAGGHPSALGGGGGDPRGPRVAPQPPV